MKLSAVVVATFSGALACGEVSQEAHDARPNDDSDAAGSMTDGSPSMEDASGSAPDAPPALPVAAECVPSSFSSNDSTFAFNDGEEFRPGQLFVAGEAGTLETIEVGVSSSGPAGVDLDLHETDSEGNPTTLIASASIPSATLDGTMMHAFDFSSENVALAADTSYAIVAQGTTSNNVQWLAVDESAGCLSTAGGNHFFTQDGGSSWLFQSDVTIFRVSLSGSN